MPVWLADPHARYAQVLHGWGSIEVLTQLPLESWPGFLFGLLGKCSSLLWCCKLRSQLRITSQGDHSPGFGRDCPEFMLKVPN